MWEHKRIDVEQSSLEWYEHRMHYRNASETAIIMGLSPWISPLMLYNQKKGLELQHENAAMAHGLNHESDALNALNLRYPHHDFAPAVYAYGPYSASLDGITPDIGMAAEIKCPVKGRLSSLWKSVQSGIIPPYYRVQIEQQMRCADASESLLWVWCASSQTGLESPIFEQDNALWNRIQDAWELFQTCLDTHTPPAPTHLDSVARTDPEWLTLARQYHHAKQALEAAQQEVDQISERIKLTSKGSKQYGAGMTVTRYLKKGNVNYKAIPELKALNLDHYRDAPSWQHRITLDENYDSESNLRIT